MVCVDLRHSWEFNARNWYGKMLGLTVDVGHLSRVMEAGKPQGRKVATLLNAASSCLISVCTYLCTIDTGVVEDCSSGADDTHRR